MITETQIQNFLYETDDQINSLANKIFNNQKTLLGLINNGER
jgi:hypothetical protein